MLISSLVTTNFKYGDLTGNPEIEKFHGQNLTGIKGLVQVTSLTFGMGEFSVIENHWPLPSPKEEREISLRVDNKTFGVLVRSVSFQNNFEVLLCTKYNSDFLDFWVGAVKAKCFQARSRGV